MRPVSFVLSAFLVGLIGCHASVKAKVGRDKAEEESFDEPAAPSSGVASENAAEHGEMALMGARHDVALSADKPTANCQCLAVAVGDPRNGKFRWEGDAPATDPERQMIIAFSTEGIACAGVAAEAEGPSYWGYKLDGDDVVVYVESGTQGRPQTLGAVIPRPAGEGQVFVKPASKKTPYGRGLGGEGTCRVSDGALPAPASSANKE